MNTNLIVIFDDLKYKSKVRRDGLMNLTVWTVIPFIPTAVCIQNPTMCLLPEDQLLPYESNFFPRYQIILSSIFPLTLLSRNTAGKWIQKLLIHQKRLIWLVSTAQTWYLRWKEMRGKRNVATTGFKYKR